MDSRIRCSVNNCEHWNTGNYCDASTITVSAGSSGSINNDISSMESVTSAQTPSESSSETYCCTFKSNS